MRQYLLGQLSEDEQTRVEDRSFADREFQEALLLVENELIDAYVLGRLPERDRPPFEKYFLTAPERRERVAFARSLAAYVSQSPEAARLAADLPQQSSWWRSFLAPPMRQPALVGAVAAAVLLVVGSAWLVVDTLRLRSRLAHEQAELAALREDTQELRRQVDEERARNAQLQEELARAREPQDRPTPGPDGPRPVPAVIASLVLSPGTVREIGKANTLTLPPGAGLARLQVVFRADDYRSYQATLRTAAGQTVWSRAGLRAQRRGASKVIMLNVPAQVLQNEDYYLTLSGVTAAGQVEDLNEYPFRAVKK